MTLQVLVPTPLSAADVKAIVDQAVAGLSGEQTVIVIPIEGAPTPVLTPTLQAAAALRGVVVPPGRLTAVPPAPSRLGGSA